MLFVESFLFFFFFVLCDIPKRNQLVFSSNKLQVIFLSALTLLALFANIVTFILGEPSLLPAGFEEELVQLEDLIGEIFDDSEKSFVGDIFVDSAKSLVGDIPDIVNPAKSFSDLKLLQFHV